MRKSMNKRNCATLALAVGLLWSSRAQAAPISYQADSFLGPPGIMMQRVVALPDLTGGGRISLGEDYLGRPDPSKATYPPTVQPIDQDFTFSIREQPVPGQTDALAGYALLTVHGHVTGSILGPSGMPPRNGGSYSGTATSIDVATNLPGVIPQQLLDLASHPERIHISGDDSWSFSTGEAFIEVGLTIDLRLPAAIPEPTTLVTFAVILTCWGLFRKQVGVASRHNAW
jgi:hypothetical protein